MSRSGLGSTRLTGPDRSDQLQFVVVIVVAALLWTGLLAWRPIGGVLGSAMLTGVLLAALALWWRRMWPVRWRVGHDIWLALPVLIAHLAVSWLAIPLATRIVPLVGEQADALVFTATSGLPDVVVALVAALLVAPMEEVFWRGSAQPFLGSGRTRWARIAITTVAFMGFHLPTGQLPLIGAALLGGVAWGWLRERTEGLVAPIIAHAGWTVAMVLAPPT